MRKTDKALVVLAHHQFHFNMRTMGFFNGIFISSTEGIQIPQRSALYTFLHIKILTFLSFVDHIPNTATTWH
jgi:hypothetical protein